MQFNKSDASKKEIVLGLNSFDQPAELVGKYAWIKLITYLFFTKKGSYPSNPDIGIGLQNYEYSFMDDAISNLQSEAMEQCRTFLPDIPLESIVIKKMMVDGKNVLVILISLVDNGSVDTSVIAMEVAKNIIDFEISM